jgi:choline monooxygenase
MSERQLPHSAETAPAAWYRDPGLWRTEREKIFAKAWQFVTHESALPEPGSWVAETIAGYPVLIVRDETGALRSFHNVCRHRAGPLTQAESGRCEGGALVCRYHGWRYALDGRLRNARDFGPAAGFDPRDFSLFPMRVETWRGFVFIALDKDIAPLVSWMAPVDARLGPVDWSRLRIALRRRHDLACNWKTYVENYLEGYHLPVLHPALSAEVDAARYCIRVEGRIVFQDAPTLVPGTVYDGNFAWMWPNTAINVYSRGLMMERIAPIGHDMTRLDYLYLTPDGEKLGDETLSLSDTVTAEDKWIVERVQENLNAGVYDTGRLSPRHESAVAAFQAFVRDALANV